ncbi:hypothetical protein PLANTIT3_90029 [Plantibacter sp. T3]|nr:hypothetical protein PLANTIT3_90029 [Plantibacter sp. T3]
MPSIVPAPPRGGAPLDTWYCLYPSRAERTRSPRERPATRRAAPRAPCQCSMAILRHFSGTERLRECRMIQHDCQETSTACELQRQRGIIVPRIPLPQNRPEAGPQDQASPRRRRPRREAVAHPHRHLRHRRRQFHGVVRLRHLRLPRGHDDRRLHRGTPS